MGFRQIELVEGHSRAFKGMQEGEHETCAENCRVQFVWKYRGKIGALGNRVGTGDEGR